VGVRGPILPLSAESFNETGINRRSIGS